MCQLCEASWTVLFRDVTIGLSVSLACGAMVCGQQPGDVEDRSSGAVQFFESKIRPVLVEHCYACHSQQAESEGQLQGGLHLDNWERLLKGGDSGPAVVPGEPRESLLLQALRYESFEMPPDGQLPDSVVRDFESWIARGAAVPPDEQSARPTSRPHIDLPQGRQHWAYRSLSRPAPPSDSEPAAARRPLDRWIADARQRRGLIPAPAADRQTLIRRLAFDVTGLPPSPEQIDRFLYDRRPDAYQQLVDRLLASPRFGERWGRHWLDVVRFAESLTLRGFVLPAAWRYRDYVIASFNGDRPFDEFITQQLAGDLLEADSLAERQEQLVATTFLALGNNNLENQDKSQLDMDVVDEQLEVVSKAFLAQTVACARCHDHKFDPIPTSDYYALAGIFRNLKTLQHANVSKWLELPLPVSAEEEAVFHRHDHAVAELQATIDRLKKSKSQLALQRAAGDGSAVDTATEAGNLDQQIRDLQRRLADLSRHGPHRPTYLSVQEREKISDASVHIRGSVHNLGPRVPRGFLQVASWSGIPEMPTTQSGRKELAAWIASQRNPLTARVMANRVWHWLFGQGLVRTTDNFGTTGDSPSHGQLLDYLAVELAEHNWSVKYLVREIVLSDTYRMASTDIPANRATDPENRFLWRTNRRRMEVECLVDAIQLIGGNLRMTMGGSTIRPGTATDYDYRHESTRRAVYWPVLRNSLPEIFDVFDFPNPSLVVGRRDISSVAQQALLLMNDPWILDQSQSAAARLLRMRLANSQRLDYTFRLILGRLPSDDERRIAADFLRTSASAGERQSAWAQFVQALFASPDFRYLQ